jgi:glycosyltransferase involved in cell wall biosynthesis
MRVAGVRAAGSLGVARYCDRLAAALAREGIEYEPRAAPLAGAECHWHLANSSRQPLWQAPLRSGPFVVTVHDVVPRTRALRPLYRGGVYPLVARRARRLVAHSRAAADLLVREAGIDADSIAVVPHPAPRPASTDRTLARRRLGWREDELVAVLPGAIKPVKLVAEAVAAAQALPWRLVLAGPVKDPGLAAAARRAGTTVLAAPADEDYEAAIVAADVVLVLRSGSVGETNGPLLDALGAGRAVLATPIGSIEEVAGGAARLCEPTVRGIRGGLEALADAGERAERERLSAERAAALTWDASARAHAELFSEAFGA